MAHIVLYVHGFGVCKDDRGPLADMAAALPEAKHIYTDLNEVEIDGRLITVNPIDRQVEKLARTLGSQNYEGDVVDIVAHSQGCIVAAIAASANIRRVIFLAPPENINTQRLINLFGIREGKSVDMKGESVFPRRDGAITNVPAAYWDSLAGIDVLELYKQLSNITDLIIVSAKGDDVLGETNFESLGGKTVINNIIADHSFSGDARQELKLIAKELLA